MNVYFIYKRNNGLLPELYGVTDNKEIRDVFLKDRDKTLFISLKKDFTKKDYKLFLSDHYGYELKYRNFDTDDEKANGPLGKSVSIVTTFNEEMQTYLKQDRVYEILAEYTNDFVTLFNDELLEALNLLGYFNIYKFCHVCDEFVAGVQSFDSDIDFPFKVDSFGLFLHMYGHTFSKD